MFIKFYIYIVVIHVYLSEVGICVFRAKHLEYISETVAISQTQGKITYITKANITHTNTMFP